MDFVEAREKRREILVILKQQQAEDAACVNQIKAVAIQGKQSVLRALAEWLTSIRPGQAITTDIRNAFETIAAGFTVEDWLNTQAVYDKAEARLKRMVDEERLASAAYDAVEPWGVFSSLFAEDTRKKQIEPVKARRDAAAHARESAQTDMETARKQLAAHCDLFLRAASSPERLQKI